MGNLSNHFRVNVCQGSILQQWLVYILHHDNGLGGHFGPIAKSPTISKVALIYGEIQLDTSTSGPINCSIELPIHDLVARPDLHYFERHDRMNSIMEGVLLV